MLITVSELLETSWRLYTQNWRMLKTYIVLLFVPPLALLLIGLGGAYLDMVWPASTAVSNVIILALFVASIVFSIWATIALTLTLSRLAKNESPESWPAVFNVAAPRIWPLIFATVLAGLIIFGGTLLLIVPGVIFAVWYAFVAYAVILRDKQGLAALAESKQLVAGRWVAILWRLVAPNVVFIMISSGLQSIILLPFFLIRQEVIGIVAKGTVSALILALVTPLIFLSAILLFHSAEATPVAPPAAPPPAKS